MRRSLKCLAILSPFLTALAFATIGLGLRGFLLFLVAGALGFVCASLLAAAGDLLRAAGDDPLRSAEADRLGIEPLTRRELRRVRVYLRILNPTVRQAIILWHLKRYSISEISERLDIEQRDAKWRLREGTAELRRELARTGRESPPQISQMHTE